MLGDRKVNVFISSTSDLAAERAALGAAVPRQNFDVYLYENDQARKMPPREWLQRVLLRTDLLVGVLGARFGSVYPDTSDRSIVQWEIETAASQENTEVMAYLKEYDSPEAIEPEQLALRQAIGNFTTGIWKKQFRRVEDLVEIFRGDLIAWLADSFQERHVPRRGKTFAVIVAVSALVFIGGVMTVLVANRGSNPRWVVLALGAMMASFLIVLACMAIFWRRR